MPRLVPLVLFLLAIGSTHAAERPAYVVEVAPAKTVEAVLSLGIDAPKLVAREWVLVAPRPPELPCQTGIKGVLEPGGKAVEELSPLRRPLLVARVPGRGNEKAVNVRLRYDATLHARKLVPLAPGTEPPAVAPLKAAERGAALRPSKTIDFEAPAFQKWLDAAGLRKAKDEGEVDFARRVFVHIRKGYAYEYKPDMKREATAVCQAKGTDCGGMSVLFVAALRANQVPARVLVGRWALSAKAGEKLGTEAYAQQHVKAEFFADGVGWVPVDLSSAVLHDRTPEGLRYFGQDPGDFVVFHVDLDLVVDSVHFGKNDVALMQGPMYWVTGGGNLDKMTTTSDWQVKAK